ncbi:MAG: hypothetical protein M5U17_01950 [Ignavibacterium sp.]|nr:hypothetical protein [Ignavibacterium sp.]
MNNKLSKKIRKEVNKKTRFDFKEFFENIAEENLSARIKYALKIVFKCKLGEPVGLING